MRNLKIALFQICNLSFRKKDPRTCFLLNGTVYVQ